MPLHHIKALLGHASLTTTDIYLNAERVGLRASMQRVQGDSLQSYANNGEQGATARLQQQDTSDRKALVNYELRA